MTGLDLDALRGRWAASQRKQDEQLTLDVAAVRAALAGRTTAAFRRHSRWLLAGLVAGSACLALLLAFVVSHRHDAVYLLASLPLLALVLAELVVDVRQWRDIAQLDLSAPVLQVRARLDAVRTRRLAMTRWILLTSVGLWLPAIAVTLKGLFGADLLRGLHPSVVWVNLAVGLLFIPIAWAIARWISRRYATRPGYESFLDDAAGRSWSQARHAFDANQRFEDTLEAGGAELALHKTRTHAALPAELASPLRALKRRLQLAVAVFSVLLLANGLFNALHGGDAAVLVPSISLHLVWVINMVAACVHLARVARLDFAASDAVLREQLLALASLRARVGRAMLAASPVLGLLLAQVLVEAVAHTNLLLSVSAWPRGAILVVAVLASAWLIRRAGRDPVGFLPGAVNALSFGAIGRTQALLAKLPD
ncbi:hypothetical protein [Arenimonas oryziterrae]|uniref:Uncharacterized protein n=1 Tax=Arenimonas oryziterrae DSM 21050 = YC6267 TaxID=1121015 RepID=A0A091AQX2_9GAMM|nr:hypothetical protein [Arenimonas oryziterrae]KFN42568.1 hypothetical protein N789_13085 [Arenimonas oryziterrae DSM 21050 = YC6267]